MQNSPPTSQTGKAASCLTRALSILAASIAIGTVPTYCFAQVYSWIDPATGQKTIRSSPPPWYTTGPTRGPRTIVTLGPFLLDDTGRTQSERAKLQEDGKRYLAQRKESESEDESEDAQVIAGSTPAPPKKGVRGESGSATSNKSQAEIPAPPPPLSRGGPTPVRR
jgi:hypothetical protein